MGSIGVGELLVVMFITAPLTLLPVALAIDAAMKPDAAWAAAGQQKLVWVALLFFSAFLCFATPLTAGFYLLRIRPELTKPR
jgi:hypothetical protein